MRGNLSPRVDAVRQRLVDLWLDRDTVDDQVDGVAAVASAFCLVLEPVLGGTATRAIFNRTSVLASRRDPRLEGLTAVEGGLDLAGPRASLRGADPAESREALDVLLEEMFVLLDRLLGSALPALLGDVEAELAARRARGPAPADAPGDEERR